MSCKSSDKCDNANICRFAKSTEYNLLGGSCFEPKDPQTNEEWLRSCDTNELIKFLMSVAESGARRKESAREVYEEAQRWDMWLKGVHDEMQGM